MEWMESRVNQLMAIGALVTTLFGFGYAGAELMGRLDVLEEAAYIAQEENSEDADNINNITTRFEGIEARLEALKEKVDGIKVTDTTDLKVSIAELKEKVKSLESSGNPLTN